MQLIRRNRREFITLVGGAAAAWPLAARAQQPQRMRHIGVFMNYAEDDPQSRARIASFLQGLEQVGWRGMDVCGPGAELGSNFEECLGESRRDVHVSQLGLEHPPAPLDACSHLIEPPVFFEPEHEAGGRVLFRELRATEQDTQQRQAHRAHVGPGVPHAIVMGNCRAGEPCERPARRLCYSGRAGHSP